MRPITPLVFITFLLLFKQSVVEAAPRYLALLPRPRSTTISNTG